MIVRNRITPIKEAIERALPELVEPALEALHQFAKEEHFELYDPRRPQKVDDCLRVLEAALDNNLPHGEQSGDVANYYCQRARATSL